LLVALAAGCAHNQTADQNAATATQSPTTTTAPDNSEITTSVDASGTKTETRTFRNNPHLSKVVVTTRDGKRTVKAYSPSGEERVVETTENALEATGDAIAKSAGFVADKGEDAVGEAGDKAEDVKDKAQSIGEKTADKSKEVGEKTVEVSKKAGEKTVEGAKKVGDKTVEGAKKAGSAVKKVIP
jgi:histone H3/H4